MGGAIATDRATDDTNEARVDEDRTRRTRDAGDAPERRRATGSEPPTAAGGAGELVDAGRFAALAAEHLRRAEAAGEPAVVVFVEVDASDGATDVDPAALTAMLADASEVLRSATRDDDLVARLDRAAFCVLLSGDATGGEATVLARIVEGLAVRGAGRSGTNGLALSLGAATYHSGSGETLQALIERARRRMNVVRGRRRGTG
jgi:GGDEF domain-containing protein